jgi:hypothetical protein
MLKVGMIAVVKAFQYAYTIVNLVLNILKVGR